MPSLGPFPRMTLEAERPPPGPSGGLEERISQVGSRLAQALGACLDEAAKGAQGTNDIARTLGLDKPLVSRLLKAIRHGRDPLAVAYYIPGPEPLRRFLRAAERSGARPRSLIAARSAVEAFGELIRREVGDRSSLDTMLSGWLPEARAEFELRRKQSAYRAMSQLRGVSVDVNLQTAILHPSKTPGRVDHVWIIGLLGIHRLKPGAAVHFATHRLAPDDNPRRPLTLDGRSPGGLEGHLLNAFCHAPPATVDVRQVGEAVHYTLAGEDFGPRSLVDLLLAEVNLGEIPSHVPRGSGKKGYVFADVGLPSRELLFDVLVHEDVFPGSDASLRIYDTGLAGVADVNDPVRDVDRLNMAETLRPLTGALGTFRAEGVPSYGELVRHVFERMGWDGERFRGYRVRVEYPLLAGQYAALFDPPEAD